MTIPTLNDPDFPYHARDALGNTLACIRLDEVDDWAFLLRHVARWIGRAYTNPAIGDHYRCFAADSSSYCRSDLLQMRCELTWIAGRLEAFIDRAPST
jgi:hypothetical protein